MTSIVQRVTKELKNLPPEKQEYYGTALLEAIEADQEADRKWEAAFAATTDEQWGKMAEQVREQRRRGEYIRFDDFLRSP